jgi:hypothetical protein
MSNNPAVEIRKQSMKFAPRLGVALVAMTMSTPAWAEGAGVGGHVGLATPLVTVAKKTTTISDQFTMLTPIGVTVKPGGKLVVDFEVVVANPVSPPGTTGLVIDPGIVYDWGGVATGLRLAFATNSDTNVGLIPLVNVGLVNLGGSTWFVEAAFPTFVRSSPDETGKHKAEGEFNVVLHTGIGF